MKKAICFALSAAALAILGAGVASATTVTIPSTATGGFGAPNPGWTAMVAALAVTGPGVITITYNSGTIQYGSGLPFVGPNGGTVTPPLNLLGFSMPLDEAVGINTSAYPAKNVRHIGGVMGAFVPASVVANPLFRPVDGTKNLSPVGIVPSTLFFVGNKHSITVNSAGTLYLGINDDGASDNAGSFTMTAVTP